MPDVLIEVRGDWLGARKGDFIEAIKHGDRHGPENAGR